MELKNKDIIAKMSLEDKVKLCSGSSFWSTIDMRRYGLKSIFMTDGPHGLRKQEGLGDNLGLNSSMQATCFPTACASSCTWNTKLLRKMGEAIGEEALEQGVDIVLGPGVNIKRNPLCGRNFEYFSEDPFLAGKLGAAWINGVQSKGPGASLKHFAANNQENERLLSNSMVDERALREIYLAPFEIAVKEGNPDTVMCSYNKINGVYSSDNQYLLTDILRNEWKFDGLVVTDWGALNDKIKAFKAGLDLEMPSSSNMFDKEVIEAVNEGRLSLDYINKSVDRMITQIKKSVSLRKPQYKFSRDEHHNLSKKIASEGAVLLKNNDGILPIGKEKKVALIGALARNIRYQGAGSSHINPTKLVNIVDGFREERIKFNYYQGYEYDSVENIEYLREAIKGAKESDVAVLVIGLPDEYESEGFDREDMNIPKSHIKLLKEVAKVNENTVVVLLGGSPIEMSWIDSAKAILDMHLSGQAIGSACAEILIGKVCPSGKLSETYPVKYDDVPNSHIYDINPRQAEYRESIYVGYRYYEKANKEVRFPFGFGLSYTNFEYRDEKISKNNGSIVVSCKVKNTGDFNGAEVVQLYISDKTKTIHRPKKELKGFEKVFLKAGEEKEVSFDIKKRAFAHYNVQKRGWNVSSGKYEILIGASSNDIRLIQELKINGGNIDSDIEDLPKWYINPVGKPSREDFEVIYGKSIKTYKAPVKGEYDLSCSLEDIRNTNAGAMILGMKEQIIGAMGIDSSNPQFEFIENMVLTTPLQRLAQQSGNKMLLDTFKMIIDAANNE